MDKKTIIGLVLMVAVFVGFSFYESKQAEKYNEWKKGQIEVQKALEDKQKQEREAVAQLSDEERMERDSMERVRVEQPPTSRSAAVFICSTNWNRFIPY